MANPNPSPKTRFKSGQSGNPRGKEPLPEHLKQARKWNRTEIETLLNQFMEMSPEQLQAKLSDKSAKLLELMVARIVAEAIKKGDQSRLTFLLDRLIGPVPKAVDISSAEHGFTMIIKDYAEKK